MSNPTLIISGASRGLGATTARIAAEIGANVVLSARSEAELGALAETIQTEGGTALVVPGDVTRAEDCARIVAAAVDRFGGVDGLVNNAGRITPIARLAEVDPAEWETLLRVNLCGPLLLTQAALPHLRAVRGRVINVSSGAAQNPRAAWSAYCTSKAGLNMLTRVLALEEPDIIAIAFRPGAIDTPMQGVIRAQGQAMSGPDHARFVGLYERGELFPPEKPGRALAVLALHADPSWSGGVLHWQDERVGSLVARVAPAE